MTKASHIVTMPDQWTSSVVFASPHSGKAYPSSLMRRTVLDELAIRSSEDAFVDQLVGDAPRFGAPLLCAQAPRAYVDLNRAVDELDPALIEGIPKVSHNPRIASGLGVIPRVVSNGRSIYSGKLTVQEAKSRLDAVWKPYHSALQGLLKQCQETFGQAILIDMHSMPHEAIDALGRSAQRRPQVVLGDRFGAAADAQIVDQVEAAFQAAGLRVARNSPFAGAYITQAYGRPSRRQHAVQIEIDRALYMDEKSVTPLDSFDSFRELMTGVIADLAKIGASKLPMAAE
ncbi:MAG: N-formylglutamate amidohydrolase [Pseudomonadota bacterium]